jgi:molybdate transport system permease protein
MSGMAQIVVFTLGAALLATAIAAPFAIVAGWLLARFDFRGKSLVETLVVLPLVVPPVATGLILLKLFGRRGPLGALLHDMLGIEIVFNWKGVVIAMAVMAFPLFVRTARIAFEQVPRRLEDVARTLGASRRRVFVSVTLPLALSGVLGGGVLAFARAIGEFGATIMVAGAIPGETLTMAVAIFNDVQLGKDDEALVLLAVSVAIAFGAVYASEWMMRRRVPGSKSS